MIILYSNMNIWQHSNKCIVNYFKHRMFTHTLALHPDPLVLQHNHHPLARAQSSPQLSCILAILLSLTLFLHVITKASHCQVCLDREQLQSKSSAYLAWIRQITITVCTRRAIVTPSSLPMYSTR